MKRASGQSLPMDRVLNTTAPVQKLRPANTGKFGSVQPPRRPVAVSPLPVSTGITGFHKLGLFCCCGFLFSGYGNDLSIRLLGGKAYLSMIFGAILPIAFLGSGTALRGLQTKIGKCWLGLIGVLMFSALFSISRGESFALLQGYIPKAVIVFYYCCAFALT